MVLRPSSSSSTKIPNLYLRKKRKKWPISPYKTTWHHNFNQQQALQTLKKSCLSSKSPQITQNPPQTPSHLLNCLINSFNSYQCDPTPSSYNFIIKTLIKKSQFNELNLVLSHLENCEKFETQERVFIDLIRVYGEKGMINEAIKLFFRIPNYRCVPTVVSLNTLLTTLCQNHECLRVVPWLLLKCKELSIRFEESSFSILINALCRIGKVDYALKLLSVMVDDEISIGGKLFSLVLSSLCRQKCVSVSCFEVMGVWEDMKRVGFRPRREDFSNVIEFLGRRGKGRDGFDVLCEMKREGIKPDIACYTMVLYGLVEEEDFGRVEELFDEILIFGLVPNLHTYNVYIKGLGRQNKADFAYTMIGSMEELGCPPDLVAYNSVLEAFCNVGELRRVREVWSEMQKKGFELNGQSYTLMIDALVTGGEVIEACNMLEEMLSKSFLPMLPTFDKIICGLCHKVLVSEALHTLELVYSCGVLPSSTSWEALLLGLNLNLDHVRDVFAGLVNLYDD